MRAWQAQPTTPVDYLKGSSNTLQNCQGALSSFGFLLGPGSTDRQRIPTESRQSPDRVPTVRQLSTDRDRQSPTELRPHLDSDHVGYLSSCQSTDRQTDRPTDRQTAPKHRQTDRECTDLTWMVQPLLDCVRPHWLPVEGCQTTAPHT